MKNYLILLFILCLSGFYACEQESITGIAETSDALTIRNAPPCDLTQIPLYIPPAENVQGNIDFSTAFPVTESTDYETSNGVNLIIQNVTYTVNGTPMAGSSFANQNNTAYQLTINVSYYNGFAADTEKFSLQFEVNNKQLTWGRTNYCEYDSGAEALGSRSSVAALIMP